MEKIIDSISISNMLKAKVIKNIVVLKKLFHYAGITMLLIPPFFLCTLALGKIENGNFNGGYSLVISSIPFLMLAIIASHAPRKAALLVMMLTAITSMFLPLKLQAYSLATGLVVELVLLGPGFVTGLLLLAGSYSIRDTNVPTSLALSIKH